MGRGFAPTISASSLDGVGVIGELLIDGQPHGVSLWAPHRLRVTAAPGPRAFEVRITNSMANAYEGLQLPSGHIEPVR